MRLVPRGEGIAFRPFGEWSEVAYALNMAAAKGFVGEHFDAGSGLGDMFGILNRQCRRLREL